MQNKLLSSILKLVLNILILLIGIKVDDLFVHFLFLYFSPIKCFFLLEFLSYFMSFYFIQKTMLKGKASRILQTLNTK